MNNPSTSLKPTSEAAEGAALPSNFEQIYTAHFGFVWRCLQGLGVPREQLDDATQETFVVVHRRLAEYRPDLGPRPWLFGILRLVAQNQRRGRVRRLHATARLEHEPAASAPSPFDVAQAREAGRQLLVFLDTLEVNRREVFYLAEIEDLPVPELAQALGIPVNTAYSRLRRARGDFAAWLSERGVSL